MIFSSDLPSPSLSDLDLLPIFLFVATPCEGKKKSGNFSEFVREMREKSGNFTFIFSAPPPSTLYAHSVFYGWFCYFVDILNFLNLYVNYLVYFLLLKVTNSKYEKSVVLPFEIYSLEWCAQIKPYSLQNSWGWLS